MIYTEACPCADRRCGAPMRIADKKKKGIITMTKMKLLALLLAVALCLPFAGCAEITDEEGAAWAQAHG